MANLLKDTNGQTDFAKVLMAIVTAFLFLVQGFNHIKTENIMNMQEEQASCIEKTLTTDDIVYLINILTKEEMLYFVAKKPKV